MATIKYSDLPTGSAIAGADLISVNQSGVTVTSTATSMSTFIDVTALSVLAPHMNLKADLSTAGASLTFTADQLTLGLSLTGRTVVISSFNQTNNLSTTGAGGKDTGTMTSPGYVAVYAIYNPSTLAVSTLATTATSALAPTIYGGANMPSGYTYSRLISVWALSANNTYQIGYQKGKQIWIPEVPFSFDFATGASWSNTLISSAVPINAKKYSARVIQLTQSNNLVYFTLSGVGAAIGSQTMTSYVDTQSSSFEFTATDVPIFTAQRTFVNVPGIFNFVSGGGFVIASYTI